MRRVPHFAACLLAIGSAVVALNWDPAVRIRAEMLLPATAPDWVETVKLYSAFGQETKTNKPAEPQATTSPEVKLLPPSPVQVERRGTSTTPGSKIGKNQNKPPIPVNASGIL